MDRNLLYFLLNNVENNYFILTTESVEACAWSPVAHGHGRNERPEEN